jgi:RNA polymerase sigma factor, sigma-70 family
MQEDDDLDLADIDAILNGDEEAYAGIVERHTLRIQKQMRNFSRDPLIMEELTQDAFVEAYTSLGSFRGDAPFRHWLARIATLTGYKYWKKRDKEKQTLPLSGSFEPAAPEESEPGDPERAANVLYDLLATLPPDDRMIMTLMYLEQIGQEEIASRMGWTRVMVAVRIYRAKQRLKKLGGQEPWKGRLEWILS